MTRVNFTINKKSYSVGTEVDANTRLVHFIREEAGLTGTKYTCNQGGCGACVVTAKVPLPNSSETKIISINACLANVHNCNGWEITTIEGLGNTRDGLHPVQKVLADNYGTQCGFCSPGFVMNMYGFTEGKKTWTDDEVERNLDGHICRCTGYRPIIHGFKQLKPTDKESALCDIEEIEKRKKGGCCGGGCCKKGALPLQKEILNDGTTMYYPTTVKELNGIMASFDENTVYKVMFGNTGVGVTGDSFHNDIISIRGIGELATIETGDAQYFVAGAAIPIETLMESMKAQENVTGFKYFAEILDHWGKVGSISLRNLASWAGNLAMKNIINSFQSDLFITLVGCGAEVLIGKPDGTSTYVLVETLVGRDIVKNREVILKLRLTAMCLEKSTYHYNNYKVMPRICTALAYINASFNIAVDENYKITKTPILAYGGINAQLVRASNAENTLTAGLDLTDIKVLQAAIDALDKDIIPDDNLVNPPKDYRISVAKGMFYKYLMGIIIPSGKVDDYFVKAAEKMIRPTSSGKQSYDDNKSTWPLGKPIPKIESDIQCTGEIKFNEDMDMPVGTLYGKFFQSTEANAKIDSIDSSQIHTIPGIVGFVTADDIPGNNDVQPWTDDPEPVFASGRVLYHGQAIGLLVASEKSALDKALSLIKVTYSDMITPILTAKEAIAAKKMPVKQPTPVIQGDVDAAFEKSSQIVEGEWNRGSQYHFYMECQSCTVMPFEDTYNVVATTQWITGTQHAIANVLAVDNNKVDVTVHRLGGGFGGKIDACNLVHTATAIAACKFRKPVHVTLTLEQNMTLIGWRDNFLIQYKMGVDANNKLNAVKMVLYGDTGCLPNDASAYLAADAVPSCYSCDNWLIKPIVLLTDTACNTYMRSPGSTEGITSMEYAMEHMARTLKMDPLEFRKLNMIPDGGMRLANTAPVKLREILRRYNVITDHGMTPFLIEKNYLPAMLEQIEANAEIKDRKSQVVEFNNENRWRKRGLAVMPMLWPYGIAPVYGFGVFISVYAADGSVIVTPGGVEMGQGLNTKVAQITAYELGCDMDKISMRAAMTITGANSNITGGSCGSNVNLYCAQQAAKKLRARLDATGGTDFKDKVTKAFATGVPLSEYYWNGDGEVKQYAVYGVACTEVEVDTLTGNYHLLRTDMIVDAGTSPSPLVDIGQIEGALAIGQGLFTTEGPILDPKTGAKLNFDTWHYKPIMPRDISTDLRVTLLSDAPNPTGVADSKVVNEPPLSMAFCITLALRDAITSARKDAGNADWFQIDCPMTVENIQKLCLIDPKTFLYKKE